jgi:hypothetical protein
MKRAILGFITCWAIASTAMGATPPPPQKKAVTPQKKSAPAVVNKGTPAPRPPVARAPATGQRPALNNAAKTPPKATPPATTRRYYYARQPVRRYYSPPPQPNSDRFREIQDALAAKGYLKTPSNGVWDKDSMDAMQHFQQDQNLDATGRLTARSLMALGLGPKNPATTETTALAAGGGTQQ